MTKLTKQQKQDFIKAYVKNELDTLFNGLTREYRLEMYGTEDKETITKELEKDVQGYNTIEDVQNGFDDVYDGVLGLAKEEYHGR